MARWRDHQTMESPGETEWEELSFEADFQAVAMRPASNVVTNFKPMMNMMTATVDMLETASRPHFGLSLPGHKTDKQQYAPLGVLNVASGRKL